MSKFTKTLVAAAVAGLFAGSAQAISLNGLFATASGKPATATVNGNQCKKVKDDIDVSMLFLSGGSDGPNSGEWDSELFDTGIDGDGEGGFIASKPGKTLTMDMSILDFSDLQHSIEEYIFSDAADCKNPSDYNFDTEITKFDTKISKNGDQIKVRMNAEGTYEDTSDKDRKVKVKVKAKMDRVPD